MEEPHPDLFRRLKKECPDEPNLKTIVYIYMLSGIPVSRYPLGGVRLGYVSPRP